MKRGARIGIIDFLNSRPLLHAIEAGIVPLPRSARIVKGTPRALNEQLLRGDLDCSFVSSIEYARHSDELLLQPGISINSQGFVDSVALFHEGELRSLEGGAVAVTRSSATSDVLLRILLEHHFRIRAGIVKTAVDLASVGSLFSGALLIGDEALDAGMRHPGLKKTDLGEAWREFSGHPMVFALLAARREFASEHPRALANVHQALLASRDWGTTHLDEVARAVDHGLSAQERRRYFERLDFHLDGPILAGLRTFYEYAYKLGEIPELPALEGANGER